MSEVEMSETMNAIAPGVVTADGRIKFFYNLEQGSDDWLAARCGLLTASEMKLIVTPTFKPANNDKERAHFYELLAQRVTGYVEPRYISDDMLRGQEDEVEAKILYAKHYAPVDDVGFITNEKFGFKLGYSPDGLVGNDGLIECKSRRQKFQAQTILSQEMPDDYLIQVQTGLLVSERKWCDFISYSGGMPMVVLRIHADDEVQGKILAAAKAFEDRLQACLKQYETRLATVRMIPTDRREEVEIVL